MISSKKIKIITGISLILSLIYVCSLLGYSKNISNIESTESDPQYKTSLFGTDIISIEILAEENDWKTMLTNAINEEFIMVDVIVNGVKFENVGIRPKGNSSLSQVAQNEDSDRYSFRLQFDKYISGQTCFGLDSFVINNMISDNTYIKEYISYELMEEIGVDTPYFGFADINVNGEGWGLYLAVETYGDSYESRTYGTAEGIMYNVKSMEMPEDSTIPNRSEDSAIPKRSEGKMMGNRNSNGGSLEYTSENSSSYSSIFDNVVGKATETDYQKVITALNTLSSGENLEEYFDVDQVLRYLAAHTIVVNLDSYSSGMAQNYYLYEYNGQITILPWDYNLSFGGFQNADASSIINFPIDTPVSGVEMSSRPLIAQLFSNEEYLTRYHNYLQELMTKYFSDGKWEAKVAQLQLMISNYVEKDATAFCTYEEFQTSIETLTQLGYLRYKSIQGQLDGTIPSTLEEQSANPSALISGEEISLSSLGTMMSGNHGESKSSFEKPPRASSSMVSPNKTIFQKLFQYLILFFVVLIGIFIVKLRKRTY